MHRLFLGLIALTISNTIALSQALQGKDLFDKLLYISKGDSLPYRLLKPVNPQAMEKFPLVIFLHGAG
ncbi:phospholipase, partial [Fulvivirgaceae bacterium PWU20]|nr:phospholipase [Chryseosolibacter indicus]